GPPTLPRRAGCRVIDVISGDDAFLTDQVDSFRWSVFTFIPTWRSEWPNWSIPRSCRSTATSKTRRAASIGQCATPRPTFANRLEEGVRTHLYGRRMYETWAAIWGSSRTAPGRPAHFRERRGLPQLCPLIAREPDG